MTKAIFLFDKLTNEKVDKILRLKFKAVFISHTNLEKGLVEKLRSQKIKIYAEIGIFAGGE